MGEQSWVLLTCLVHINWYSFLLCLSLWIFIKDLEWHTSSCRWFCKEKCDIKPKHQISTYVIVFHTTSSLQLQGKTKTKQQQQKQWHKEIRHIILISLIPTTLYYHLSLPLVLPLILSGLYNHLSLPLCWGRDTVSVPPSSQPRFLSMFREELNIPITMFMASLVQTVGEGAVRDWKTKDRQIIKVATWWTSNIGIGDHQWLFVCLEVFVPVENIWLIWRHPVTEKKGQNMHQL